jgi:hypothetical protein
MSVAIDDQVAAELARAVRGTRSGDVEVLDVETERRFDRSDEEYLLVVLVLSEPKRGAETWPVDDVYEVRMNARNQAVKLGLGLSQLALSIRTSGDSQTADEPVNPPAGPKLSSDEGSDVDR